MGWRYAIISLAIVLLLLIPTTYQPTVVHAQLPYGIPREETLIAEDFGGRMADPYQWNIWLLGSGARWQNGFHQLCLTAVWYTNYTDGSIVLGTGAELPIYNPEYTVLKIKLKPGLYWGDGVEHTAEDWVYTLKKALEDVKHSYAAAATTWIKNVYAEDKYTVVIELTKPNPHFWLYFAADVWSAWWYPMPAHIFKNVEAQGTSWHEYKFYPPVCLGPYKLVDVDPTGYWTLWTWRDDWDRTVVGRWAKEHGMPWVGPKYVLYVAFDTEEQRIAAIARHELDYAFDVTPEGFEAMTSLNPYARSWSLTYPYHFPAEVGIRGIFFNLDVYPYNLTEVRWALTLAINSTDFLISTHKGINKIYPAPMPYIPGTLPVYDKLLPLLEQFEITLPNGTKFKPYDPYATVKVYQWAKAQGYIKEDWPIDKIRMYWGPGWWKYAPGVAAQLLESVGFKRGPDGRWYLPDGKPWTIVIKAAGPWEIDATRMAYGVAEQWRRFGIDVKVQTLDSATFWSINFLGDFEVWAGWGYGMECVGAWSWPRINEPLHPKYYKPIGNWSSNFIRLRDPEYGKYLDKLMMTPGLGPRGTINEEYVNLVIEFILYRLQKMYITPLQITKKLPIFDTYYWVGFPTEDAEPKWISYWDAYFYAGTQWLLQFLKPRRLAVTPTPRPTTPTPTPTPTPAPGVATVTTTVVVTSTIERTVISTVTQTATEWTITAVLAVILFIVGLIVGLFIKRK
jgi:peptide/nickel transport system substrate-binding protein